ncbi:MAG: hypothetical protein N3E42_01920, partial [Candidatus Bipolaricaulota bacterium]|nr:hypothetical protein [Candidatus Bipolaricaulota bacterium]
AGFRLRRRYHQTVVRRRLGGEVREGLSGLSLSPRRAARGLRPAAAPSGIIAEDRRAHRGEHMAKVAVELELEQLAQAILKLPRPDRQRLWNLLATLEEAQDPGALKALRESEADVKAGRLYTLAEIFGDE